MNPQPLLVRREESDAKTILEKCLGSKLISAEVNNGAVRLFFEGVSGLTALTITVGAVPLELTYESGDEPPAEHTHPKGFEPEGLGIRSDGTVQIPVDAKSNAGGSLTVVKREVKDNALSKNIHSIDDGGGHGA